MDPILLDAIEYNGGGINTLLSRGAVKSVQRGVAQGTATSVFGSNYNHYGSTTINFSQIDAAKAMAFATAMCGYDTQAHCEYSFNPIITSLNNSSMQIKTCLTGYDASDTDYPVKIYWTVIEFY